MTILLPNFMNDLNTLHTNQKLIVNELLRRDAHVEIIDKDIELLKIIYKNKTELLLDRFSSVAPFNVVKLSADKYITKKLLASNNISVPIGNSFDGLNIKNALIYANTLKYPLVLKPNWGSHGDYIKLPLINIDQVESAIWQFITELGPNEPFILEEYFPWKEHRLFITKSGGFAVINRDPAFVTGDGLHTLDSLIDIENNKRLQLRKNNPSSECQIVIDNELIKYIATHYETNYVPKKSQKCYLRYTSNLAKGGKAIDETDIAHESIKLLAKKVLKTFPGLPCCGIDLLCNNIMKPLDDTNHVIIEVNSNPGLAMHVYPTEGISRPVYKDIVDTMFPWIPTN